MPLPMWHVSCITKMLPPVPVRMACYKMWSSARRGEMPWNRGGIGNKIPGWILVGILTGFMFFVSLSIPSRLANNIHTSWIFILVFCLHKGEQSQPLSAIVSSSQNVLFNFSSFDFHGLWVHDLQALSMDRNGSTVLCRLFHGHQVFDILPIYGKLEPGETQVATFTCSPRGAVDVGRPWVWKSQDHQLTQVLWFLKGS